MLHENNINLKVLKYFLSLLLKVGDKFHEDKIKSDHIFRTIGGFGTPKDLGPMQQLLTLHVQACKCPFLVKVKPPYICGLCFGGHV